MKTVSEGSRYRGLGTGCNYTLQTRSEKQCSYGAGALHLSAIGPVSTPQRHLRHRKELCGEMFFSASSMRYVFASSEARCAAKSCKIYPFACKQAFLEARLRNFLAVIGAARNSGSEGNSNAGADVGEAPMIGGFVIEKMESYYVRCRL